MRFQVISVLLQATIAAAVEFTYTEEYSRILRSLGTEPDVEIEYDGSDAVCAPGTGRRLHGEKTEDPACFAEKSWEFSYTLQANVITFLSCAEDKVLRITSTNPGNTPTSADCNFLWNTAADIAVQPEYDDKLSLHAQIVKGVQLLCGSRQESSAGGRRRLNGEEGGWPAGLPISHTVNFDAEWAYQRSVDLFFDAPEVNTTHFSKPPENFMYDEYYQSLCFAVDEFNVADAFNRMLARITSDGPCSGSSDMTIGRGDIGTMTFACESIPQDASTEVNFARDNCFGRCGGGCGGDNEPTQYTNDCADYDFCVRFMVDREGPGDCYDEFLHTIDDTLWSGNCADADEVFPEPVDPNECTSLPTRMPTDGPTAAPTVGPTASPSLSPTAGPTVRPTDAPIGTPTKGPVPPESMPPTVASTASPTGVPSKGPTDSPTRVPTIGPTFAPTLAPTQKPTYPPFPAFSFTPKVITFGQGKSCTAACDAASGNWTCTQDSLYENNFEIGTIATEVKRGLNLNCSSIDLTMGTMASVAKAVIMGSAPNYNIVCKASEPGRAKDTFDCDATVPPNEVRLCACYNP